MSKFGFLKISAVSPFLTLASPMKNAEIILKIVKNERKKGVAIVAFPQLCLTGCSCASLFLNEFLVEETKHAAIWLARELKNEHICCIIGLCLKIYGRLFNCAAVIFGGKIRGIVIKREFVNGFFDELNEVFNVKNVCKKEILFNGVKIPVGSNLIFKFDDAVFGVQFGLNFSCVEKTFVNSEINLIFCLMALEFDGTSKIQQINLVKALSLNLNCAVVFTNTGLFESSTDRLYCGFCGFVECGGNLIKFKEQNSFKSLILNCDVDVLKFEQNFVNRSCFFSNLEVTDLIDLNAVAYDFKFDRKISKTPYLVDGVLNAKFQCLQIFKMQVLALARRVRHVNARKLILGLSGGLDSTLALLVAVRVCKLLQMSPSCVLAVFMPGFGTSEHAKNNVFNLVKSLEVDFKEISIVKACKQHFVDINHDENDFNVVFENAQARERAQILLDLANDVDGLVLGTSDMSEIALGFSTFGGDSIASYGVNSGVCKTLVRKIVEVLAHDSEFLLKSTLFDVLKMPISPELKVSAGISDVAYQKTEEILGSYLLHDFFMYYFVKFGFSVAKVKFLALNAFLDKFSKNEINKTLKIFIERFFSQQFKRSCMPDGAKLMPFSLSPSAGFKLASDCSAEAFLDDLNFT